MADPDPAAPVFRFDDRTVLLTGAATGIGAAAARAFAALGASVVIADLDFEGAEGLAVELREAAAHALAIRTDVTRAEDVGAAVSLGLDAYGGIDVLVNAAGGFLRRVPAWEMPEEEWDSVVDASLKSVFLCSKAVLPAMIEAGRGRIVNVASGAGRAVTGISGAHYAAAKAGALGLTRRLAREVAEYGITVNAVAPGTTMTPRIEQLYDEERLAEIADSIPIGRIAKPEDHVGAIVYLASDAASYVTGATLDIVGGRYLI